MARQCSLVMRLGASPVQFPRQSGLWEGDGRLVGLKSISTVTKIFGIPFGQLHMTRRVRTNPRKPSDAEAPQTRPAAGAITETSGIARKSQMWCSLEVQSHLPTIRLIFVHRVGQTMLPKG
jgi:hypothetical protein